MVHGILTGLYHIIELKLTDLFLQLNICFPFLCKKGKIMDMFYLFCHFADFVLFYFHIYFHLIFVKTNTEVDHAYQLKSLGVVKTTR